MTHCR
jgi:hypothetical protein